MDNQNEELYEEQSQQDSFDPEPAAVPRKKKKRRKGLLIFLLVLILALAGITVYYFMEREKPQVAVKNFMSSIQNMDYDKMSSLLQSNDLSALDSADVRTPAYEEFFKGINAKMTCQIKKTQFNIQNRTADITVHIKYIDGSDIYKESITDFLKAIVSTAFSGESMTEQETQEKLASILVEKSASVEDKFSEADITYPLIEANGEWKIVALDDATVKIMSANFKNVEDEITQKLVDMEEGNSGSSQSETVPGSDDRIDMSNERFTIRYTQHKVDKDFGGSPCLLVYYDYTNNGTAASSAMVDVSLQAYQNGETLTAAIPEANEEAIDRYMSEIQPGQTVNVCQAFSLNDMSQVTLQAGEAFSFGGGTVNSQILTLQ